MSITTPAQSAIISTPSSAQMGSSTSITPLSIAVPPIDLQKKRSDLNAKIALHEELELLAPTTKGLAYLNGMKKELGTLEKPSAPVGSVVPLIAAPTLQKPIPTPFEEFISTMKELIKEFEEAGKSSEPLKHKAKIETLMKKVEELSKQKFDLNTFSLLDKKHCAKLADAVREGYNQLKTKFPNEYEDLYHSHYLGMSCSLYDLDKVLVKATKPRPQNVEQGIGLCGGICLGHALAIHSGAAAGKEGVRVGSFLQSAYELSTGTLSFNHQSIGNLVLASPQKYLTVINKGCILLGYDKDQFLNDLNNPNAALWQKYSREEIANILGKIAYKQRWIDSDTFQDAYAKEKAKKTELEQQKTKIETITQAGQIPLSEDVEKLNELEKEYQQLGAIATKAIPSASLVETVSRSTRSSVPSKIMQRRKLKLEAPVYRNKPLSELQSILQTIAPNKKKYNLGLIDVPGASSSDHNVVVDFENLTICDMNDYCLTTRHPKIRTCKSVDELLETLTLILNTIYDPGEYVEFNLTPVTNN